MNIPNTPPPPPTISFQKAIERHDAGALAECIDEKMAEVCREVIKTGKKGTVSIKLSVEPNGQRGVGFTFGVDAKAPSLNFSQAFYYVGADGSISRDVPDVVSQSMLED